MRNGGRLNSLAENSTFENLCQKNHDSASLRAEVVCRGADSVSQCVFSAVPAVASQRLSKRIILRNGSHNRVSVLNRTCERVNLNPDVFTGRNAH